MSRRKNLLLALSMAIGLILGPIFATAGNAEKHDISCASLDRWLVLSTKGTINRDQLKISNTGILTWAFPRTEGEFYVLGNTSLINGFSKLEFDVYSNEPTVLAIVVDDMDGAKFNFPIQVAAASWKHVEVTPSQFQLSEDSKVKKAALNSSKIGGGFGLLDLGGMLGSHTPNAVQIRSFSFATAELPNTKIPAEISGRTVEITQPGTHRGNIVVGNGGVLRIRASRFKLAGNVTVDGGTVEFLNTALFFDSRFAHDRQIIAKGRGLVRFSNSKVHTASQIECKLLDKARLEILNSQFTACNLTTDTQAGTSILIQKSVNPGEIVIGQGSNLKIVDTSLVLLWPTFTKENPCKLTNLYSALLMPRYVMPKSSKMNIDITNSRILWGVLTAPGSDLELEKSKLMAAGLLFSGTGKTVLSDLKNEAPADQLQLSFSDRKFKLTNSKVKAWNLYASDSAEVSVSNSLIGEAMTFNQARIDLKDSTCDGTGGYVSASNKSSINLDNCTLKCALVAKHDSHIVARKCHLQGDATVSDRAKLELLKTEIQGKTQTLDQGILTRN